MTEPHLHVDRPRDAVDAIALVLHGGRAKGTTPARPNQLAVLRMHPFVAALRRAGRGHGLAVAYLRYRVRGWNGSQRSPVADVDWALDRLTAEFPAAAVALVGHSMGGRAALYAAGHEAVRTVVGLAPWVEPGDPTAQLAGRHLLIAHGDHDRVTSAANSAVYAKQATASAADVGYVTVRGDGHAMLRRASLWHDLATAYVLATVRDAPPEGTVSAAAANAVQQVLAGTPALVV